MRLILFTSLIAFFAFLTPFPAQAQSTEEILSFETEMEIRTDGKVRVQETIIYDFGTNVKHGIYRNLPTDKKSEDGNVYRINVDEIEVLKETNEPYPFERLREGEDLVLKIGDPDETISGVQTYRIRYLLSGAMSYFQNVDELYWNPVGTDWDVPIVSATTTIRYPSEVDDSQLQYTCFVGEAGTQSGTLCAIKTYSDRVTYETTNILPGEGKTVVLRFPIGAVAILEPERVVNFFDTMWGKIVLFMVLTLVAIWYILYPMYLPIRWWLQGRDPDHQGIGVAQSWFEGPKLENGRVLTPAETGAVIDEKIQLEEFSALVVSLAQRGYITIVEKKKNDFELHKTEKTAEAGDLLGFEQTLLSSIFSGKTSVRLKDEGTKIAGIVQKIEKEMYEQLISDGLFPKNPKTVRTFYAVMTGLATVTFNILLILSAGIFGRIMPKKTLKGVHAANIAKSLKNFLSSQEKQLEFQADRQMLFEKLLPYAISFGVEKIWAKRFEDLKLKQPDWYQGTHAGSFTASTLSNNLHSSFAASLRSAATMTTSTSGFSSGFSGGSVGGGGGGGGGGSW